MKLDKMKKLQRGDFVQVCKVLYQVEFNFESYLILSRQNDKVSLKEEITALHTNPLLTHAKQILIKPAQ